MSNPMDALMDVLLDKSGAVEAEVRPKLEKAEKAVREHIAEYGEDVVTNGELAFGFSTLDKSTLAWYVTILLRDRIEFGG